MTTQSPFRKDCEDLLEFLRDAEDLIGELVEDRGEFILVRFARDDPEYRVHLRHAWTDARDHLQMPRSQLRDHPEAIRSHLKERGLTGAQLAFKLYVFRRLRATYKRTKSGVSLRRVLGQIDVLLKSLGGVLTQIDALGEIKETLERLLKRK